MATTKWANDIVMEAHLDKLATAVALRVCSGANNPANRADAVSATLAMTALTPADFTKSDGSSGRKVTISAKNNLPITVTGDATCVTLDDGTTLLFVTPCTTQTLTSGGTVDVPAFSDQVGDPI